MAGAAVDDSQNAVNGQLQSLTETFETTINQ